jgi:nucleoside-diphosphate-sugar epimerase
MNLLANTVPFAGDPNAVDVVLGASGGLGRAVVEQLSLSGRHVRAVSRTVPNWSKNMAANSSWVTADLEDLKAANSACEGALTVYFAAQPPYGEWPERFPAMTTNVIEASAQAGAKLVMVDNLYMYGAAEGRLHEQLPRASTGRKGVTRARMEDQLLQAHRAGKVRVSIGRLSDYYGPNGPNTTVSALVFEKAIAGKAMQWPGRSDVPHTLHYLADAARGLLMIGNEDRADGQVWHLPAPDPITGDQFMALVNDHITTPVKTKTIGTQMMRVGGLFSSEAKETVECMYQWTAPFVIDSSAFIRTFGPVETTPHPLAIRNTIASLRTIL